MLHWNRRRPASLTKRAKTFLKLGGLADLGCADHAAVKDFFLRPASLALRCMELGMLRVDKIHWNMEGHGFAYYILQDLDERPYPPAWVGLHPRDLRLHRFLSLGPDQARNTTKAWQDILYFFADCILAEGMQRAMRSDRHVPQIPWLTICLVSTALSPEALAAASAMVRESAVWMALQGAKALWDPSLRSLVLSWFRGPDVFKEWARRPSTAGSYVVFERLLKEGFACDDCSLRAAWIQCVVRGATFQRLFE